MAQQILNGIEHLNGVVADSRKVMLVCDGSFPFLSIKTAVESIGVPFVKFDQFTPNPLYEDVCKGVELFNQEQCDTILAVGGGSTIDVAKCIKLYCRMPADKLFLEQEYHDTGVQLIAIPTTAGTGSESTRFAVIYYGGKKQSVTHESIIPNVAILEPQVLKTLPVYQKKCTMMDALCQGIESWWSVNSTDESRCLSEKAVTTIMHWWRDYIFDNSDEAARQVMAAANLAGRAICITQTTAPHAFSYKITSLYKLPHGHAVAVCLPEIWQYMQSHPDRCIDRRGTGYLQAAFKEIAQAMQVADVPSAIGCFREMMKVLGLQNPVSSEKRDEELHTLSTSVNPIRLRNNPVELDAEAIMGLYHTIIDKPL